MLHAFSKLCQNGKKEEYELPIPRGTAYSIVGGHDWGLYAVRLGGLGVLITDSHPTKQWSHNNVAILETTNPLYKYIYMFKKRFIITNLVFNLVLL